MCGICGFLIGERESKTGSGSSGTATRDELTSQVRAMASTLRHRGPDDAGEWVDAVSGVALGHRRLSILDLSPEGAQPMLSACGRYAIVFNGEIYNFRELRAELEQQGASFRGSSDTEVLVEAMSLWGVEETLVRALGMFALALWDLEARKLTLARDRVGKKPLYYGWNHGRFYFASELKALHAHPEFRPELSRDTLALFVAYSYVPSPYSIYDGLHKLPPGSLLVVESEADASTARPRAYWSAASEMEHAAREPSNLEAEAAVDALDELLRDAVGRRMIADVELGALLSGGIDSSLVVSVMQALSSRPVKTFSIGFQEAAHDESEYAAEIARHLGTDHTTRIVTAQDALALMPKLPELYDEPFADTSQIPTYLVSALAREKVTVALSGDGGDELFAGYNRYFTALERWPELVVL